MLSFTQYMINYGVPQQTLILLLMLPIITTIIAFARQVIGIKGFGIYTPLIISVAFAAAGLKSGLLFFATVIITSTISRLVINQMKLRLLYLPRMAIIVIATVLFILIFFFMGVYTNNYELTQTSVFAVLIIIAMTEKFLLSQIQRSGKEATILTLETLLLAIICYYVINWGWLQGVVLDYPLWVIAIMFLANLVLGKWTGLRLSEYYRFKKVIARVELPDKK